MSEENKTVFEVGDTVEAFGVIGTVKEILIRDPLPVIIEFPGGLFKSFPVEGKREIWHLDPSLKLIEKAKRKVKKKFWIIISDSEIKRRELSARLYTEPIKSGLGCQVVEIELEVEE